MAIDIAVWYDKYGPMIIRRCWNILKNEEDALDAVHDVFMNLIKANPKLHGSYPSSLLYTMATNTCLNRLRNKKREVLRDFGEEDETSCFDEGIHQVEAEMMINAIFKDESEMNRAICFMYHVDNMTLREIGDAVVLSIGGVKKDWKLSKAVQG